MYAFSLILGPRAGFQYDYWPKLLLLHFVVYLLLLAVFMDVAFPGQLHLYLYKYSKFSISQTQRSSRTTDISK